jgi:hypothetical protein
MEKEETIDGLVDSALSNIELFKEEKKQEIITHICLEILLSYI